MITTQRAQEFDITPQGPNETITAFRERVSGILREQGHIIEAHEALRNCLYDNDPSGNVLDGIAGAMLMTLQGKRYARDGANQVGDDVAVGAIARD